MRMTVARSILWGAFAASSLLAAVDLIWIQGMFTWMIAAPLVFVTGAANVAVSLWKREAKSAGFCLLVTLAICGSYAALLAWSLN